MPTNSVFGSGHEVVTSTTRPGSPVTGQLIYESDTQNFNWYTGSAWTGLVPAGAISAHASATAPSGWLLCYGQAVSRSTYPALFAAISTTYGSGDGSTTFNVPDMRGVRPAGADNMGGSSAGRLDYTAATSLGTLLGSQYMAAHTHTYSLSGTSGNDSPDHGHQWPLASSQGGQSGNDIPARSMYGWDGNFRTGWRAVGGYNAADRPHTHTINWYGSSSTEMSGGSGNMPPSMVLSYVIKY
jgi:microcystin-dependent protein